MRFLFIFLVILTLPYCNDKKVADYDTGPGGRNGITSSEITIGSCAALSGHASFLGTELMRGSLCLINEINKQGGVHNRRINLITLDDMYEPANTLPLSEKLVFDHKVFILMNYVGTPTAKRIVPFVNREKIPIIGLFTGAEFLRTPFQPYVFNVRASYFKEVEVMVDIWVKNDKKKIAVFMQDDAFGAAVKDGAELALTRHNLDISITGKFKRGEKPDMETVKEIAASGSDAVIMVGTSRALAEYVSMSKNAGLKKADYYTVSFVGSEAFAGDLLAAGDGVSDNVYVTQVVPSPYDTSNSVINEFQKLYRSSYPDSQPNYVALEGFINAKIVVEAIKRSGSDITRGKFMAQLEGMRDYNAGTGFKSNISPQNHSFFEMVYVSAIHDGKFELINSIKR